MKKTVSTAISVVLALLLVFSAARLPLASALADASPVWTVPAGYNSNDYNALAAFLEISDENGVKNGQKLSSSYDPSSPATWGTCYDPDYYDELPTVEWTSEGGEYRVRRILMHDKHLVGDFDVSGLSALFYANISANEIEGVNLSGCTSLWTFDCYDNLLAEIDVSVCPMLHFFRCDDNMLVELDLSSNGALVQLTCSNNMLFELDVSANTALEILDVSDNLLNGIDVSMLAGLRSLDVSDNDLYDGLDVSSNTFLQVLRCSRTGLEGVDVSMIEELSGLYCIGNPIVEFDLHANPVLMLNELKADGNGTVGCELNGWYTKVYAVPNEGASFVGWYDAAGELISIREEYEASEADGDSFTARFASSSVLPGDADSSGSVTTADAILALRCAMGLIEASSIDAEAADIDGSGSIGVGDAVSILRLALGI